MKMKQMMMIAMLSLLTVTAVQAEHEYNWSMKDRFTYAHEGELFLPNEFSFDAFANYTSTPRSSVDELFTDDLRHGTWGGGVGLNYFFNKWIGISTDLEIGANGGQFIDSTAGNLVLRLPFDVAHVAPYIFGGGGGQFDPESQWIVDAGAGLDFRINHWTGIFVDARYIWPDKSRDYGLFRSGFRFAF